jgi:trimethylamine--corrinoid protein Co-methyltransferase
MGHSDAKMIDAQAGIESGLGSILAALAGINMIAGVGMLNLENSQSLEKLVIDHEICGMAQRLINGIEVNEESLAVSLFKEVGPHGDFLPTAHTLKWFRKEPYMPSDVIDRKDYQKWEQDGSLSIVDRAKSRVTKILSEHIHEPLPDDCNQKLKQIMRSAADRISVTYLPHDLAP